MRFLLCLLLAACDDGSLPVPDGGALRCVPGASAACACTDGNMGAQICKPDGTFDVCVCSSSNTTKNGGSTTGTTTGGSTTGGTTSGTTGGTTTGGTTSGTTGGTMQPNDCGHPNTTSWCSGTDVQSCGANGMIVTDTRCAGYNEGCASGKIGGNGDFADWNEAACGTQCPFDNAPPNVVYYCEGTVLWECGGFLASQLIDCAKSNLKCVDGMSNCQ